MAVILCNQEMWVTRTTIMIPRDLKLRARRYAKRTGISMGRLIRDSLASRLTESENKRARRDPLFADEAVFTGPVPSDISDDHDRYLYTDDN